MQAEAVEWGEQVRWGGGGGDRAPRVKRALRMRKSKAHNKGAREGHEEGVDGWERIDEEACT